MLEEKRAAKRRVGSLANGRNFQNFELELGKPERHCCVSSLVRGRDVTCCDLCVSGSAWVRGSLKVFLTFSFTPHPFIPPPNFNPHFEAWNIREKPF